MLWRSLGWLWMNVDAEFVNVFCYFKHVARVFRVHASNYNVLSQPALSLRLAFIQAPGMILVHFKMRIAFGVLLRGKTWVFHVVQLSASEEIGPSSHEHSITCTLYT
jgi:hypothetical protein